MTTIELTAQGATAWVKLRGTLTAGTVGARVELHCSRDWDGLRKILKFRCGGVECQREVTGDTLAIPTRCLVAGCRLEIALDGWDGAGTLRIPTGWANCALVLPSAAGDGEDYPEPPENVTAELLSRIEELERKQEQTEDADPAPTGSAPRVYCWGDSLTQGIGGNVNGWHLISYPAVLSERCNAVNLGILSDNVPTIMARLGADPVILNECVIPASASESVVVGNTTDGLSLESGRIAKLLKYGDCGINPCYVNDVPCILFRDYASDTTDDLSIRLRRLEDGEAITVSAGTKLVTFGAKHYRDNGLHIFWMGANGGYGTDEAHSNLAFSDYLEQLQKCVDYVSPADYLIVYARERKDYAADEAAEVAELKSQFAGHVIDLVPQLLDRGLLYGETANWDGTLTNGVPSTLDSGDGCHFSFYGYMAIGKIIWEYVAQRLNSSQVDSGDSGDSDTPAETGDALGTWAYKLKAPKVFAAGSVPINTGFKPFAEGKEQWTIAVKYADGIEAQDDTQWGTLLFCEVENSKTQLKVATPDTSTAFPDCNVLCNAGGFSIRGEDMNLTLYDSGYHTFIATKNGDDYAFYVDNNKIYGSTLGYPQGGTSEEKLYIGGWKSGWGMLKGTIEDVRIYDACLDDGEITTLNDIFAQ